MIVTQNIIFPFPLLHESDKETREEEGRTKCIEGENFKKLFLEFGMPFSAAATTALVSFHSQPRRRRCNQLRAPSFFNDIHVYRCTSRLRSSLCTCTCAFSQRKKSFDLSLSLLHNELCTQPNYRANLRWGRLFKYFPKFPPLRKSREMRKSRPIFEPFPRTVNDKIYFLQLFYQLRQRRSLSPNSCSCCWRDKLDQLNHWLIIKDNHWGHCEDRLTLKVTKETI